MAKEHCQQLTEIGLDLTFSLQSLLVKDIRAALQSYKDIIIEATKHRNSEEMWRRMNLMTPEALAKLKVRLAPVFFFFGMFCLLLIYLMPVICSHSISDCSAVILFLMGLLFSFI